MKRMYFKYGAMGCSKSANALMVGFNYRQRGFNVVMMKPSIDTRDVDENGNPLISSRIGLKHPCIVFNKDENLEDLIHTYPNTQVVIVDEAQFCTSAQVEQLKNLTQNDDIVVLCFGLKTNFKGQLFEGSKRLIELCESIQEIKSICRCGAKATMNARIVNGYVVVDGNEVQIGGDESYEGMCYSCYKKYQKEKITPLH